MYDIDGMTVVITGKIEGYTREQLKELVDDRGGILGSSVSSKTDLLIIGDKPGQSKQDAAEKHDVPTITADEFMGE